MTTNPARWMTDNYDALKDTPFSQLTLFGSHDSGMSTTLYAGGGSLAGSEGLTQAQSLSIQDQILLGGVRYLDLRPAYSGHQAAWYTAHWSHTYENFWTGWLGISLADAVQQIAQAYEAMGEYDVLLIELGNGTDLGFSETSDLDPDQLSQVAVAFTGPLQDFVYSDASSPNLWNLTPGHLVDSGKRILIFAGDDTAHNSTTGPIFRKSTNASYQDLSNGSADNYGDAIMALTESMLQTRKSNPSEPFILPFHCTGNAGKEWLTLQDMAADMNPLFIEQLAGWSSLNIVSYDPQDRWVPVIVDVDYVSSTDLSLLDACIGMNFGQFEGIVPPLITLDERCTQGPATAWWNSALYLAWSGTDSHLNVMSSTDITGFGKGKYTSKVQKTDQSPALCPTGDMLTIAWAGTDGKGRPNFSQVDVNGDTITDIANPVILGGQEESAHGLAMAYLNGVIYAAWTGTDNNHSLNVGWTTNGRFLEANNYTSSPMTSSDSPALCVLNDGVKDGLWVVWKGMDGMLYVAPIQFEHDGPAVTNIGPATGLGQASEHGPAAAAVGKTMYIAWVGNGYNMLNIISTADGQTFGDKCETQQSSNATPALGTDGEKLYCAWTSTDQHLNIARFLLPGQSSPGALHK